MKTDVARLILAAILCGLVLYWIVMDNPQPLIFDGGMQQ